MARTKEKQRSRKESPLDSPNSPAPSVTTPALHEDVFHEILSHLKLTIDECNICWWGQRKRRATLRAACLVNKTFQRLATPLLYESVLAGSYAPDVPYLLRTLLEVPHLARCIRHLVLHDREEIEPVKQIDTHVGSQVRSCIAYSKTKRALIFEGQDAAQHRLQPGEYDQMILLSICTSITNFAMNMDRRNATLPGCLVNALWTRKDSYLNLTDIRVARDPFRGGVINWAVPLLQMPRLKTFGGCNLHCRQSKTWNITSQINKAVFRACNFSAASIEALLLSCPELRSLTIQLGQAPEVNGFELEFDEIGRAIRTYGAALEYLNIQARDEWYFGSEVDLSLALGNLRSLSSLHFFGVPAAAFYDPEFLHQRANGSFCRGITNDVADVLPHSLETLVLYYTYADWLAPWEVLEAQLLRLTRDTSFAVLSKIRIPFDVYGLHESWTSPTFDETKLPDDWTLTVYYCQVKPNRKKSRLNRKWVECMVLERSDQQRLSTA